MALKLKFYIQSPTFDGITSMFFFFPPHIIIHGGGINIRNSLFPKECCIISSRIIFQAANIIL